MQPAARKQFVELARAHDVLPVAIVLDLPKNLCTQRNSGRPDRTFGSPVIHRQHDQLRRSLRGLNREGFRKVHVLRSPAQVEAAVVVRERLLTDYRDRTGPFDVIGDVHGCRTELEALLAKLGYLVTRDAVRRGPSTRSRRTAGRRCSSATWSTGDRTRPGCSGWSWAWWRRATPWPCPATTRTS